MTDDLAAFIAAVEAGHDLKPYATTIERMAIRAGLEIRRDRPTALAEAYADMLMMKREGIPVADAIEALRRHYGLSRPTVENNVFGGSVSKDTKQRGNAIWNSRQSDDAGVAEKLALLSTKHS